MRNNPRLGRIEVAGRVTRGWWGRRYSESLSGECGLDAKEAAVGLAAALVRIIPRIPQPSPFLILPALTRAILDAVFRVGPPPETAFDRLEQKEDAIGLFARRACARPEKHLEDCVTFEILSTLLGEGPSGPRKAAQVQSVRDLRRLGG